MIPFNKPFLTGGEINYITDAHARGKLSGDGHYTKLCSTWLESNTGTKKALLTHSCTASLEMAAILADILPGDEVIMPSFTFVSTANAFVLRGGVPIFVDIRSDTLNIDESQIESAITSKTKAIVVVHYAGVACEMDAIMAIARKHNLIVIEDAAQAILSNYKGKPLGSIGDIGCLSFHETKNIISGEGGALLINNPALVERAEIIREKGTNRSQFFRGDVDKYTWIDIGSSYLPGEIIAAFLYAQLQNAEVITKSRLAIWDKYHEGFSDLEVDNLLRRPIFSKDAEHNAHMYYLILPTAKDQIRFIDDMRDRGINCVFHYIPLHSSGAGLKYGRAQGNCNVTSDVSGRLVRLPMWVGVDAYCDQILAEVHNFFS
jgi:dTDP-4-amino-4,6-dideoxygalactose transaminase